MAGNQLIVEVIGDTTRLTKDLRSAQAQIKRFAATAATTTTSTVHGTGADALLASVQNLKTKATGLADDLGDVEERAAAADARMGRFAIKAGVAGLAVNVLGRNMQALGGDIGRVGEALGNLTSGNIVGFFQSLQKTTENVFGFTEVLVASGKAAEADAIANAASASGFQKVAQAARDAAAQIREATAARNNFVDSAKIRDSTSVGAIESEVSSLPLPKLKTPKPRKGLTAAQRNAFFDSALARDLDRTQDLALRKQVAALREIEKTITARIAVTKDITRKLNLEDELVRVGRQRKSVEETIKENALAAAQAAREAAAALKAQRLAREKAIEEARKNAIQAKQFRQLGLAPDGGDIVPTIGNLQKQLASLTDRISGGGNITSKLRSQLEGARKVLKDQTNKATVESRRAIKELFDTIRSEFDKGSSKVAGPLTKTTGLNTKKIVAGLGLSPDEIRGLRGRLSSFNSGGIALAGGSGTTGAFVGGRPIVVENHTTITLDGHTVAKSVTRSQQKTRSGNPLQRRGPNRGG